MKSPGQKLLCIVGMVGPIVYIILLTVLGAMWTGYDPVTKHMSVVGSVDSPFRYWMDYLGFCLLGASLMAFTYAFHRYFHKDIWMRIASTLLLSGGMVMFIIGFVPCDSQCIVTTITGSFHSAAARIPATLVPAAAMLCAIPLYKRWGKNWGRASFFLGMLSLMTGPLLLTNAFPKYTGLVQRSGMLLALTWIVIMSVKLYTESAKHDKRD